MKLYVHEFVFSIHSIQYLYDSHISVFYAYNFLTNLQRKSVHKFLSLSSSSVQTELLEQRRNVIRTYTEQYSCAKWDRYKYDFRALFTASWDIYLVAGSAVTPDLYIGVMVIEIET
jgi:hypothetical protein